MKDEMNTNISADDQISGLIAGLPRVSAPADFDLKLRGRIARQRTAPGTRFRLPAAVAYAMGLGVVLIAFGLFGMAWMYSGNVGDVPVVATTAPPAERPADVTLPSAVTNSVSDPQRPAASMANMRAAAVKPPVVVPESRSLPNPEKTPVTTEPSVGSLPVTAVKTARAVYPKGINPAAASATPEIIVPVTKPVDAKEVLAVIGVNATLAAGKMRIGSVNPGSAGANAGLKAGDLVESIDDRSVNAGSKFASDFKASSLRILREGKVIVVALGK